MLYEVLLNLHIFPVLNIYAVPSRTFVQYKEAMYIYTERANWRASVNFWSPEGKLWSPKITPPFFANKSLNTNLKMYGMDIFMLKNCTTSVPNTRKQLYVYKWSLIYLFFSQKPSFNFLRVKSLTEYSSVEQYRYVEGFQRFHAGLRLSCAACLSLQFFYFLSINLMTCNTRFVFQTKK